MIRIKTTMLLDKDKLDGMGEQTGLEGEALTAFGDCLESLELELDVDPDGCITLVSLDGAAVLPPVQATTAAVDQACARVRDKARLVRAFAEALIEQGFTTEQAVSLTEIYVSRNPNLYA